MNLNDRVSTQPGKWASKYLISQRSGLIEMNEKAALSTYCQDSLWSDKYQSTGTLAIPN